MAGQIDEAFRVEREKYRKLAEYTAAAMRDLHRYRTALYELEQRPDVPPRSRVIARKALRNWTPDLHKHPGAG